MGEHIRKTEHKNYFDCVFLR